jgi:hypothetical protein
LRIIDAIRRKGNCLYNQTNSDQGYFITTALRKHFRNCTVKKDRKKGILVMSRELDIEINEKKACDVLQQQVSPVLRLDDISAIIRNDEFLISYGNKMCAKYRSPHLHKMIRARLRSLGRFLLEICKLQNMCKTSSQQIKSEAIRCRQARNKCQFYTRNKKCVHQNCKILHVGGTGDFFLHVISVDLELLYGMEICWFYHVVMIFAELVKSCYDKPSCPTCRKECVDVSPQIGEFCSFVFSQVQLNFFSSRTSNVLYVLYQIKIRCLDPLLYPSKLIF